MNGLTTREALLTDTFVTMADTMVRDFDVVEFLSLLSTRCVALFGTGEAGLMLADESGHLHLTASSSHEMRVLELLELQHDEGPCPEAFRTGKPVLCDDLSGAIDRWPTFAPEAIAAGFRSANALPMRLRDEVIGALNLMSTAAELLSPDDVTAAQALADVATIGILQHRAAQESKLVKEQLTYALNSHITIEQAKGVVAHQLNIDMHQAFHALLSYSRDHGQRLVRTASAIVERTLDAADLGTTNP